MSIKEKIAEELRAAGEAGMTAKEIAKATDEADNSVWFVLQRLIKHGAVSRFRRGNSNNTVPYVYYLACNAPVSAPQPEQTAPAKPEPQRPKLVKLYLSNIDVRAIRDRSIPVWIELEHLPDVLELETI